MGKSLFDQAADLRGLSHEVRNQLEFEQFKATSRLVPSLLLGNIFLASVNYVAIGTGPFLATKTVMYVLLCAICLVGMAVWRQMSRSEMPEGRRTLDVSRRQKPFIFVALILGMLWACVPPFLAMIDSPQQLIMVAASLAGVFCVGGFALAPMPLMAIAFLFPIVLSSSTVLLATVSSQGLLMAFALVLYVVFIIGIAISQTRSMVRIVIAGHELAKQQKTISLLLRDFEKHSSDWLWETDMSGKFVRPSERFSDVASHSGGRY